MIGGILLLLAAAPAAYHVDCNTGRDENTGLNPNQAWRTLSKANQVPLQPGDRLRFRSGCRWTGQLAPQGSGREGLPIMIERYGEGAKPVISGEGSEAALLLENQAYWDIRGLEITNDATTAGLRRGILIRATTPGRTFRHFVLRELDVHHVKGRLGADIESKLTGGIAFEAKGKASPPRFEDVLIENCDVRSVDNTGIYLWSDASPHPRDPLWKQRQFTKVRIRGNRLSDIGKNGIGVRASVAPLIERNVIRNAAARYHGNAVYVFGCKDARIQYNEVSGTRFYGLEGAAFDSDYNSEGTIIQYNFSQENGGGLVNFCNNPASPPPRGFNDGTIVRHNVSQNEGKRVFAFDGTVTNSLIHNNTVYIGEGRETDIVVFDIFGKAPGYADKVMFRDNIIYNLGSGGFRWGKAANVRFEGNCFHGNHPPTEPHDPRKQTGDPGLASPGASSPEGYRVKQGSPCRGATVPFPVSTMQDQ